MNTNAESLSASVNLVRKLGDIYIDDTFIYSAVDLKEVLRPLITRIKAYDALRVKLENRGGYLHDLSSISEILTGEFELQGRRHTTTVSLTTTGTTTTMTAASTTDGRVISMASDECRVRVGGEVRGEILG